MDYNNEQAILNTLNQITHNTYHSVHLLGEIVRGISKFYENVPFDSECLHWILYNEAPATLDDYESALLYRNNIMSYIDKMLEYVFDINIREQVRHSVLKSLKLGHLTYIYGSVDDIDMQARIRILTRRILDNFYLYNQSDTK